MSRGFMTILGLLKVTPNVRKTALWATVLAVSHLLFLAGLSGYPSGKVNTSNLIQILSAGLAFWACLEARERARGFGRSFWALCGLSYLLWAIAQGFWSYKEFRWGVENSGHFNFTDVLFFFSFAPFAMLLLIDPAQDEERIDWQRTLDVVQVGIVILCAYLYFFYVPSRWESEEQTMRRMVSQVFLGRNLVLVSILWLRTLLSTGRRERSLFMTAAICMTTYAGLTRIANYARLNWDIHTGTWFDLGWNLPFLISALIIANWVDIEEPHKAETRVEHPVRRMLALHLTPMLMPALVLLLGANIATEQLAVASVAIMASFICYSLRLYVTQFRQSKATEALARAEERFRTVFSSNPQPSWVYDRQTLAFLEINEAAERQYGYTREEFLKMKVTEIRPEEEVRKFLERIGTASPNAGDWKHRRKNGEVFDVQVLVQPLELAGRECRLVIAVDVTEQRRLEAQLLQAQKMKAVGTLAGGIAHDFNNALTIITGYSQGVLERQPDDAQLVGDMRQIEGAAQRAAGLVRQLLSFSSQQVVQPRVMNLHQAVVSVQKMLTPLLGSNVEVVVSAAPRLGVVNADPGQVEQVLVNLALNAKDALGDHPPPGSRLSFLLENVNLLPEAAEGLKLKPGAYVLLTVSDTGCGIEKKIQARIFEPFFTTKQSGGTGLGLSTVYGIVQQSGGAIAVESEPGEGATFRVYWPMVVGEEAVTHRNEGLRGKKSGMETILVVEDDPGLRELATRVLVRAGYQVHSAGVHHEAKEIARLHGDSIDLLLTDVVMPEVSGKDLADQLTAQWPGLIVLFMSGYTDEVVLKQGVMEGTMHFIQKPFTPSSLTQKVREVLDASLSKSSGAAPASQ
ncbi:MAG TPA: response regulator [Terriglobales bacterium]|nr:response regulator [Terriglobales bacterium]